MSAITDALNQGINDSQGSVVALIEADPTVQKVNGDIDIFSVALAGLFLTSLATLIIVYRKL